MDFNDLVTKKEIELDEDDLRDDGLGVLIKVVQKSAVLEELHLSFNRLTLADGKMAEAIAHSPTLRVLSLQHNQIANAGAKRLADAIKVNETLQTIHLNDNEIGDEGAKSFADALAKNNSLRVLSLEENKIGDEGAKSLAASFEKNRTLQRVRLANNNITDDGALSLANALTVNYIIKLHFDGNTISDQVWEKIDAILGDKIRRHIQEIIAFKDDKIAALEHSLAFKDQELKNKEEEIASLKAGHSASMKKTDLLKTSIKASLEQLNALVSTVDLTDKDPEPSN